MIGKSWWLLDRIWMSVCVNLAISVDCINPVKVQMVNVCGEDTMCRSELLHLQDEPMWWQQDVSGNRLRFLYTRLGPTTEKRWCWLKQRFPALPTLLNLGFEHQLVLTQGSVRGWVDAGRRPGSLGHTSLASSHGHVQFAACPPPIVFYYLNVSRDRGRMCVYMC